MVNIGFYTCGILVIPFACIGVQFAIYQERAARFVSGFNSLSPKKEQALYDKAGIARDVRNQCFIWSAIMLTGAVLSFITPYMAIPAYMIWLVLFFKDFHYDPHKAFEKYLK